MRADVGPKRGLVCPATATTGDATKPSTIALADDPLPPLSLDLRFADLHPRQNASVVHTSRIHCP
jgi:hypothetical protein